MKKLLTVICAAMGIAALDAVAEPTLEIANKVKDGAKITALDLALSGIEAGDKLYAAYGYEEGTAVEKMMGMWDTIEEVAEFTGGETEYRYTMPSKWGDSILYLKLFVLDVATTDYDCLAEYIDAGTSPANIITDIYCGPDTMVRMKISYNDSGSGGGLFGAAPDDSNDWRFFGYANGLYLDIPSNPNRIIAYNKLNASSILEVEVGNHYINDISGEEPVALATGNRSEFTRRDFTANIFGGGEHAKIYYLDVYDKYEGDESVALKHAFRPAIKGGAVGLYDTVEKKFLAEEYGNAIAGGEISDYGYTILAASDTVTPFEADIPFFADDVVANGLGQGDVITFTGSMLLEGSGIDKIEVELCLSEGWTTATKRWPATYDPQTKTYVAYLRDADPTTPEYLPWSRTVYYRVHAVDTDGNEAEPKAGSFTSGGNVARPPWLHSSYIDAFAMNGRITLPLAGDVSEYVIQMRTDPNAEWENAEMFSDGSKYILMSARTDFTGVTYWRAAYALPCEGEPVLWAEFTIDARNPAKGLPFYRGYPESFAKDNPVANAFDGRMDRIFHAGHNLADNPNEDQALYLDLGARRVITSVAVFSTAGHVASPRVGYCTFEAADDISFTKNVQTLHAITAEETAACPARKVYLLSVEGAQSARYVRFRPTLEGRTGDGWFTIEDVEFSTEPDMPKISATYSDLAHCYPVVSFDGGFSPDYGVCLYRGTKPDGSFALRATLDAGVTSWTDEDDTLKYGQPYYYRIARRTANGVEPMNAEIAEFRRFRRLERDVADNSKLKDGVSPFALDYNGFDLTHGCGMESAFDGDLNTFSEAGSNNNNNPAVGVEFAEPMYVALYNYYPRNSNYEYGWSRSFRLELFGLNEGDIPEDINVNSCTDFMNGKGSQNQVSLVEIPTEGSDSQPHWSVIPCNPDNAYKYIYMHRYDNGYWCGDIGELELYGWTEKDLHPGGMSIFVK